MSRPTYAPPAPTLRGEIEQALQPDAGLRLAVTAKHLAAQLNAPVRRVREELEMMAREQIATTRRLRSGEVLFKLVDRHHHQWQALAGPGTRPSRATA